MGDDIFIAADDVAYDDEQIAATARIGVAYAGPDALCLTALLLKDARA